MSSAAHTHLQLDILEGGLAGEAITFDRAFTVGRDASCDVVLSDEQVSRHHLTVAPGPRGWSVTDEGSANGTYLGRQPLRQQALTEAVRIRLGKTGPALSLTPLTPEPAAAPGPRRSRQALSETVKDAARHYIEGPISPDAGDFTRELHLSFRRATGRRVRLYQWASGVLLVVSLVLGVTSYRLSGLVEGWQSQASDFFYTMKVAELRYSTAVALGIDDDALKEKLRRLMQESRKSYISVLDKSGFYRSLESEEDKLIHRTAFDFGECDTQIPAEFIQEVKVHIKDWQGRNYRGIVNRAQQMGYIDRILARLKERSLPQSLLYIAMRESNFETHRVGPPTSYGYARGMWQFIDITARRFKLRIGKEEDLGRTEEIPGDDRHNFLASTDAAMDYLEEIYRTDAKASGLLVVASYNWGEQRVIRRIRTMPEDPRQRNFWALLNQYGKDVPPETYTYVYSIFAAAVIGQNPRLFGIPMDPITGSEYEE